MEWQPIETAPKDGAEFLAFWPDFYRNNSWDMQRTWAEDGAWQSPTQKIPFGDPEAPTHWMLLPSPPK